VILVRSPRGYCVAAEQAGPAGPANEVETIRQLAEVMCQLDLSEIDFSTGSMRIRLRRGPRGSSTAPPPAAGPSPSAAAEAPRPAKRVLEIKSEGPGLFYAKPDPQADP